MTDDYHAVVLISYEEMWEKRNRNPGAKGIPQFYCLMGAGVLFFPAIDPEKCVLMAKEGL